MSALELWCNRPGDSGRGALNVTGGTVISVDAILGNSITGVGTAAVSAGNWSIQSYFITVGNSGTGTLTVTGGSVTDALYGSLGRNATGAGTATVSGGTWANLNATYVGYSGTGTLNVNGGSVTNQWGVIGSETTGVGTATVSSGTWANSSYLAVGESGTGTLNVTGGSVTNTNASLGFYNGSNGTATISNGTWANSSYLTIGVYGTGTLHVTGGSVTNSDGVIGSSAGSVGTATMSGGTWANRDGLYIGYSGTGTLLVNGGSVTNSYGSIGFDIGGTGTATVSSGTWANSGDLAVGRSGTGTLTMTGGLVSVAGTLTKGDYGTINLNAGGTLQIGVGSAGGVLLSGTGSLVNDGTLIFNRSDDSDYSGIISGTGAVTKQGAGTLTLTGTSTYAGATRVDGGSLLVNGRLGNTAVSVASGGLLGGSGTIDGMLAVLAGGTLSPGNSPGILHVGSLQLDGSSTTLMEITGTSGSLYDQIVGNGSGGLTYGGTLDLVLSGSYADQTTFHLFSNFASPSFGDFAAVEMSPTGEYSGLTFTGTAGVWTSTWTANHQRLVFTTTTGDLVVVPEPSTVAMVLAGLACGGWRMMRRRRLRQAAPLAV